MKTYEQLLEEAKLREEERESGLGIADFVGGLGGAISGRGTSANDSSFSNIYKNIKSQETGRVKEHSEALRQQEKDKREADLFDPNSDRSKAFRGIIEKNFPDVAKSYAANWNNVSAADQDSIFRPLQLKENIESRKENARILSQQRNDAAQLRKDEKTEKEQKKVDESTYRYNILKQNAENLKKSVSDVGTFEMFGDESAKQDSIVYQMAVDYAKLVDPDSVAREGEVAAAQKYMLPFKQGMGLTTSNSTASKQIDNYVKSLDERLNARNSAKGMQSSKTVIKKQYSPSQNKTKITYSDGSEEIQEGNK